jgi:hypothetical protein
MIREDNDAEATRSVSRVRFYQADAVKTTDVWLTPPGLIQALGSFDLDACCPRACPGRRQSGFNSLEKDRTAWNCFGRVGCG